MLVNIFRQLGRPLFFKINFDLSHLLNNLIDVHENWREDAKFIAAYVCTMRYNLLLRSVVIEQIAAVVFLLKHCVYKRVSLS